ncbi:MAG: type II toxin-antitoxin system HicB family antitoxin [Defluviitaleaceae bacterium]|nr:type II toxin-antitoxin system HicB family antitoxin [Defluviitaleaceae bacterium]
MLKAYPAIFLKEDSGYSVSFPDLKGCFTEGDTLEEAIEMAQEALGLYLVSLEERGLSVPASSGPFSVACEENEFISFVYTRIEQYRRNGTLQEVALSV